MVWLSHREFKKKFSKFEKKLSKAEYGVVKKLEEFQEGHPVTSAALKSALDIFGPGPSQFFKEMYDSAENDKEGRDRVFEYLIFLSEQSKEHYDFLIRELYSIKLFLKKEFTEAQEQRTGIYLENLKKFQGIEKLLKKIDRDQQSRQTRKGSIKTVGQYVKDKKFVNALNEAEKLLIKDPKNYEALMIKGYILDELREDALTCFEEALRIKDDPIAKINKGIVLRHQKRFNEAIECFSELLGDKVMEERAIANIDQTIKRFNEYKSK